MTDSPADALSRIRRPSAFQLAERDELWFGTTYNLAAAYVQGHLEDQTQGIRTADDKLGQAMLWARLLVRDVELALKSYDERAALSHDRQARKRELTTIEGPAIALLAGLHSMRLKGNGVRIGTQVNKLERDDVVRAAERTEYSPQKLIGFLLRDPARVGYRARYNLACYYSSLAAMPAVSVPRATLLSRALRELKLGVETRDLVDLAAGDLGLKEVRDKRPVEFWAVLGREAASVQPGELGRVRCIGPSFATKLADARVPTASVLAARAGNEQDARVLAEEVGTRTDLVVRWGALAWLMTHLDSVGVDGVNLLDAARVDTVDALARSKPVTLTRDIAAVNEAYSIVATPPGYGEVARWIWEAKSAR